MVGGLLSLYWPQPAAAHDSQTKVVFNALAPSSLAPFPFEATFNYSSELKQYYQGGTRFRFPDSTAEARVTKIKTITTLMIILITGRTVIVRMRAGSGLMMEMSMILKKK